MFKDRLDADGERTWAGRGDVDFGGGAAGPRVLPLPNTLPPPMVRRDIAQISGFHEVQRAEGGMFEERSAGRGAGLEIHEAQRRLVLPPRQLDKRPLSHPHTRSSKAQRAGYSGEREQETMRR